MSSDRFFYNNPAPWKKECRKQRRRQMFRYRELTKRGWAVLAAIGAAIVALIYIIVK